MSQGNVSRRGLLKGALAVGGGGLIVAAAGNDRLSRVAFPAALPGIVSVGGLLVDPQIAAGGPWRGRRGRRVVEEARLVAPRARRGEHPHAGLHVRGELVVDGIDDEEHEV